MTDVGGIGAEQLRSYIERIERLEDEKAALTADIREVYAEAKGKGGELVAGHVDAEPVAQGLRIADGELVVADLLRQLEYGGRAQSSVEVLCSVPNSASIAATCTTASMPPKRSTARSIKLSQAASSPMSVAR